MSLPRPSSARHEEPGEERNSTLAVARVRTLLALVIAKEQVPGLVSLLQLYGHATYPNDTPTWRLCESAVLYNARLFLRFANNGRLCVYPEVEY